MSLGLFVDVSNLYRTVTRTFDGGLLHYGNYRKYLEEAEQQKITRAWAYGYINVNEQANMQPFLTSLTYMKFETNFKTREPDDQWVRWDIDLVIDVMNNLEFFDVIALGTSDANMLPLIAQIKNRGKRCVIFASRIGKELRSAASDFYEIDEEDLIIRRQKPDSITETV